MSSLLITNNCRTDNTTSEYYNIPPQVVFQSCRVKQAIITNNFQNVLGQSIDVDMGNGTVINVPIEDGRYYAHEWADYVQTYLNAYMQDDITFIVQFKDTQQKFFIKATNNTANDVHLKPNGKVQKFSGMQSDLVFTANNTMSHQTNNYRANIFPSYFTIRSRSLSGQQMSYNMGRSDIVAVIPISDDAVSEFQCNDSVFLQTPSNDNYIYNQIDLKICLEDSSETVDDPIFALKLEFQ